MQTAPGEVLFQRRGTRVRFPPAPRLQYRRGARAGRSGHFVVCSVLVAGPPRSATACPRDRVAAESPTSPLRPGARPACLGCRGVRHLPRAPRLLDDVAEPCWAAERATRRGRPSSARAVQPLVRRLGPPVPRHHLRVRGGFRSTVVGHRGWSIEVFTGVPRHHEDMDISILSSDADAFRLFLGERCTPWNVDEGWFRPFGSRFTDVRAYRQAWVHRDARSPWLLDVPFMPDPDGRWTDKRHLTHTEDLETSPGSRRTGCATPGRR